jgi:RNA polymerase sigma-70 factor (ECF subfamily)
MQPTEPVPGKKTSPPPGLLGRVLRGDPDAWQRLAYLHVPLVLAWCHGRGLSDAEAEEAACEVFHKAADRLGEMTSGGRFRDWLRRLAYGYLEELRPASGSTPAEQEGEAERWLLYRRALELISSELEPAEREAARRIVFDEQTPETAAAELGLSLPAVFAAKAVLLGRLREELRDLDE